MGELQGPQGQPGADDGELAPAFYALGDRDAGTRTSPESKPLRSRVREWWLVLHPPYTGWHLSYLVLGACVAPVVNATRLVATVVGFFLAVGVGAHALDELHDRPLRTAIPSSHLGLAAAGGLGGAVTLGVLGAMRTGWVLVPFIVIGPILVVAYNAELFGGLVHTDGGFALAWGAFPVLAAYVAQTDRIAPAPVLVAAAAFGLSFVQRALSTPAREIRRRTRTVEGTVTLLSGESASITKASMLAPLERALAALSWSVMLLATGLAVARLT